MMNNTVMTTEDPEQDLGFSLVTEKVSAVTPKVYIYQSVGKEADDDKLIHLQIEIS
jgi:hypothetical protein